MKALILAAGLGTRLRPLTLTTPKPLLPISGTPLLKIQLENLYKYGVNKILINTHYLKEKVEEFVSSIELSKVKVELSHEEILLGSGGTLKKNFNFFRGEENFFIVYGDVLTNLNFEDLLKTHIEKKSLITIAVYPEPHPESKGVVLFSQTGKIYSFLEKPTQKFKDKVYANAGFYVVNKKVFKYLKDLDKSPLDFGQDLFPFLLERKEPLFAHIIKDKEYILDIGTIKSYNDAQGLINL